MNSLGDRPDYKVNDNVIPWLPKEDIEEAAVRQLEQTSELPFIWQHIAVMPDVHFGKGCCVGVAVPTKGAIVPAIVGVDIGCGMVAIKTDVEAAVFKKTNLTDLRTRIEGGVPLSAGHYNRDITRSAQERVETLREDAASFNRLDFFNQLSPNWPNQLGSLGSGNHFIEVVEDKNGLVWLFLHSGSRGIGNKIAAHHIRIAKDLRRGERLPNKDLAYLEEGTEEFEAYLADLLWAQEFAWRNREEMLDRVIDSFCYSMPDASFSQLVHCHHNYTSYEKHFGEYVYVSRKGAISAAKGEWGLIPGSMGTRSYVVQGKGNKWAFDTAPHGAGRRMSRKKARQAFDMDDFDRAMKDIEVRRTKEFLDELPGAYKDIDLVIERSKDLVTVKNEFKQIINVKGD